MPEKSNISNQKVYFESFGCQMNAYDTEVLMSKLLLRGFRKADNPEDANVIVVNTCSVREHAEIRAIGRLHELSRFHEALLVVCGCMAQRMKDKLWKEIPSIDIIAGTESYNELPDEIERALQTPQYKSLLTDLDSKETYCLESGVKISSRVSRYLSITRGCNNFCSYCIVPYLRGKVRSKSPEKILLELRQIESEGAKEVTLLGQNVSSYKADSVSFVELLKMILKETSLKRLRFITTHPGDIDFRIFELMAEDRRLCPHIHLPIQSGSNRILKNMRRGYTVEQYISIIRKAREIVPDIAFSTDIIVGFPGETEDDFKRTLEAVETIRFDSAFTFKYSPREGTRASRMDDDVPLEVKKERLQRLNEKVQAIRKEILESSIGKEEEILLDDTVKKGEYQLLKGRTPQFRNVLIPDHGNAKVGDLVKVRLKELKGFTFFAELINGR